MTELSTIERSALERLIVHAKRNTAQSRRAADFLLAWWNAGSCGSYDLTTAWECDSEIVEDMIIVFGYTSRNSTYPDKLGYEAHFKKIIAEWRPELRGHV